MAAPLIRRLSLPGALLLSGTVAAQVLIDPTLPPAALRSTGAEITSPAAPKLQMILRGPDDVQRALIDGRWLSAGDLLPGTSDRLLGVTGTSVRLARGTEVETLELLPTIAKRAAPGDAGRKPSP